MSSLRLVTKNLVTRLVLKRFLSSDYDPVAFRPRVEKGAPLPEAARVNLQHAHMEVWGEEKPDIRLLYIPGGGFCFGPGDNHRQFLTETGASLRAQNCLLNYRLAPEHAFPAALEDVVDALTHCFADELPLAVIADSAGAALALSAMMCLRDRGAPSDTACAVFLSAYTDLSNSGLSMVRNARKDPLFGVEALIHKAHHYLQGHNPTDPEASPFWGDPHGLPPSLFLVGSTEVMLDDSARMVKRANSYGCDFHLSVYNRAYHVFPLSANLSEARQARSEIVDYIHGKT